jgi:hypothetical protein
VPVNRIAAVRRQEEAGKRTFAQTHIRFIQNQVTNTAGRFSKPLPKQMSCLCLAIMLPPPSLTNVYSP